MNAFVALAPLLALAAANPPPKFNINAMDVRLILELMNSGGLSPEAKAALDEQRAEFKRLAKDPATEAVVAGGLERLKDDCGSVLNVMYLAQMLDTSGNLTDREVLIRTLGEMTSLDHTIRGRAFALVQEGCASSRFGGFMEDVKAEMLPLETLQYVTTRAQSCTVDRLLALRRRAPVQMIFLIADRLGKDAQLFDRLDAKCRLPPKA